jgi:spermidine synthase
MRFIARYHTTSRMIPWELLGRTATPGGEEMALMRQSGEYVILAGGRPLMSSRMHGSEEALADVACRQARRLDDPCVLVGGLGMGFTLRATLDVLPRTAVVVVAELVEGVVAWNRGPLGSLAGEPLADSRTRVAVGDVADLLRASRRRFDAVLLDVDNGPDAFTTSGNTWLYGDQGLAAIRSALTETGTLSVWSAREDRRFEQRLRYAGFAVEVVRVRARLNKGGPRHVIFVGGQQAQAARRSPP